jgi:hypothetical protein
MRRARNAVVILILCIIGGYSLMKKPALLSMPSTPEEMRDSVHGNPTRASRPGLNFGQTNDGELRDAVANNAAETGSAGPNGNTEGGAPPPPRGSGNGGIGTASHNPGQDLTPPNDPPPSDLSPSGPNDETPTCPTQVEGGCQQR